MKLKERGFEFQDIKTDNIRAEQLDVLKEKVGTYEELFNKRAIKFRSLGLHEQNLSDADYRRLILEEYTFLKRPVICIGEHVLVGNAKKTVEAAKALLNE